MQRFTDDSNEQLVKDFNAGDKTAFTFLYHRFEPGLYHFACRFVDTQEAYDIVADAFVRLWQQRAGFDAIPKIEHWLFVNIRYACLALLRSKARLNKARTEVLRELESSQQRDVDAEALSSSLVALLYQEINRLPDRQKQVFLLSFEQRLSTAEIAERLSLSVKTVRNQKLSAIRVLQAAVGDRALVLCLVSLLLID